MQHVIADLKIYVYVNVDEKIEIKLYEVSLTISFR
jgi:hypothetical protein